MRTLCCAAIAALSIHVQAQVQWTQLAPSAAPSARSLVSAVDAGPLGVVLFGGELSYTGSQYVNDTWRWANGTWVQVQTASSPVPRGGGAMCYDPMRNRVVYFGGWPGYGYLSDTWEFDGANWVNRTPAVSPPGRDWAGMAYDPMSQRVVMFGGHDWTQAGPFGDTWAWDGTSWTQLFPATSPTPRFGHAMVSCTSWGLVVLHGGIAQQQLSGSGGYDSDTWIWIGSDWAQVGAPGTVPPRGFAGAAWDPRRERLVVAGGMDDVSLLGDVWEYSALGWQQRYPTGPAWSAQNAAAFFDAERGEVVVFGGATGYVNRTPVTNATWAYGPTTPAVAQVFGAGCGAAPTLDVSHLAWIGGSYEVACSGAGPNGIVAHVVGLSRTTTTAGVPLPASLAAAGMPGCELLVDPLVLSAQLANGAGTASYGFPVPSAASLVGTWIYAQVLATDAGANALGLVTSHGVEHRIGGM